MIFPLSGNFAPIGKDNQQGVEAALAESGTPSALQITYADSKADAAAAVSEFRKLVDADKVSAVFAMRGPVGMSLNPISKSSHMPLLGGVGNKEFAASNEYAFQLWPASDIEGEFLATNMLKRHHQKVAVITLQDDWTASVSKGFAAGLKKNGGEILFWKEVLPTDNDFRTLVQQLKAKNVQALFLNVGISQFGPLLKQLAELKVDVPKYANFWISKKEILSSLSKEEVEGVVFEEMSTELPKLRNYLQEKYQVTPSGATISAYLATKLLSQAVNGSLKPLAPNELYQALMKQKQIETPDGNFPIKDRFVQFPLAMRVIKEGKVVPLPLE